MNATESASLQEDDLYFDFCHDLTGTAADNQRHLIMRIAFLNEMRFDSRVHDLFASVADDTGLARVHQAAFDATRQFARTLRMRQDEVFTIRDWRKVLEGMKQEEHEAIGHAGKNAADAVKTFDTDLLKKAKIVGKRMLLFVKDDLKLPWPWLSVELLQMFNIGLVYSMMGMKATTNHCLRRNAPEIDRRLLVPPNCSTEEALAELESFYQKTYDEIMGCDDSPRFQKPDRKKMERNAVWFYRNRIKGESKRNLAREYHEQNHKTDVICDGDRSTVQAAIRECERVLSLTRFAYLK